MRAGVAAFLLFLAASGYAHEASICSAPLGFEERLGQSAALAGVAKPTIAKLLRFCISYNPGSRQFGFNVLRVSAVVISVLVGGFALFLVLTGSKRRRRAQGS